MNGLGKGVRPYIFAAIWAGGIALAAGAPENQDSWWKGKLGPAPPPVAGKPVGGPTGGQPSGPPPSGGGPSGGSPTGGNGFTRSREPEEKEERPAGPSREDL